LLLHVVDAGAGQSANIDLTSTFNLAPGSVTAVNTKQITKQIESVRETLENVIDTETLVSSLGDVGASRAGGGAGSTGCGDARRAAGGAAGDGGAAGGAGAGEGARPAGAVNGDIAGAVSTGCGIGAGAAAETNTARVDRAYAKTSAPKPKILELIVFNKIDLLQEDALLALKALYPDAWFVSSKTKQNIDELVQAIISSLKKLRGEKTMVVPYGQEQTLTRLYKNGQIIARADKDDGIHITYVD
jgi:hypothetical protein